MTPEPDEDTDHRTSDFSPRFAGNSHGEQDSNTTAVQIDGNNWSVDTLVELERLRRERADEWTSLMRSVDDDGKIAVLVDILSPGHTGYESLIERTGYGRTKVEELVYSLRDAGIVEVVGRPATIVFVDDDIRLLASDVVSFLS